MDVEDLMQEATIGLSRAIQKFDPNMGFKFSTYAVLWVQQSVGRAIHDKSRTVTIPDGNWERLKNVKRQIATHRAENNRTPTPEEISNITGIDFDIAKGLFRFRNAVLLPLDRTEASNPYYGMLDKIKSARDQEPESDSVIDSVYQETMVDAILSVETISLEDKVLLCLHYGVYSSKIFKQFMPTVNGQREQYNQAIIKSLRNGGLTKTDIAKLNLRGGHRDTVAIKIKEAEENIRSELLISTT
jgi:RNA polymerase primary sigma factor